LYTGDAVGRHLEDPADALIASEKFVVNNADAILIDSDVLIAPHHGADNGSSTEFIKAVSPEWVIFSAGHRHCHPTQVAAQRYIDFGVSLSNMFRTDIGDDESNSDCRVKEWDHQRQTNHKDTAGDDDVDILIRQDGEVLVDYRESH
jgi:competence protein ComEC